MYRVLGLGDTKMNKAQLGTCLIKDGGNKCTRKEPLWVKGTHCRGHIALGIQRTAQSRQCCILGNFFVLL